MLALDVCRLGQFPLGGFAPGVSPTGRFFGAWVAGRPASALLARRRCIVGEVVCTAGVLLPRVRVLLSPSCFAGFKPSSNTRDAFGSLAPQRTIARLPVGREIYEV